MLSPSLLLFFSLLSIHALSSSLPPSIPLYRDHCASIVPESSLTSPARKNFIPSLPAADFTGGDSLLRRSNQNHTFFYVRKTLKLRILPDYFQTLNVEVYRVRAVLSIRLPRSYDVDSSSGNFTYGGSYYPRRRERASIRFQLDGFWSENSRKLCMIGSASHRDKSVLLDAVLKMNFASNRNPIVHDSVTSGILQSTSSVDDPAYFDPISIFNFPHLPDYKYTLVTDEVRESISSERNQSLELQRGEFCSVIGWRSSWLQLDYADDCGVHCSPLGNNASIPQFLNLDSIDCDENEMMFRFRVRFMHSNYDDGSFSINSTVIGEARWDDNKNVLVGVGCRLLDPMSHSENAAVGGCTLRLSWRYPALLTIHNSAKFVGQIWSSEGVDGSGYFRKIDLRFSDEYGGVPFTGPKYEYTQSGRVIKSCERKGVKKKRIEYPDGNSYNMRFDMSIKDNKDSNIAWGFAMPIFVGNESYRSNDFLAVAMAPAATAEAVEVVPTPVNTHDVSPVNISYKISINPFYSPNSSTPYPILNGSMNYRRQIELIAEGVYDAETGYLCMVACRLVYKSTVSRDCEILVKLQFPPMNGRGDLLKGTIESTRAKIDPLHFEELALQSAAYYGEVAKESIWRMDVEMTLVLVSNVLACVFLVLQIFHVKRNPDIASFISLVMVMILCVGHFIPLVLNFEAVFLGKHKQQNLLLSNGGKIEANEVAVRVITMVAFLLQVRLLQLVWTAKQGDGNAKRAWNGEKKAGIVALALCAVGGLFTLVLNWLRNMYFGSYVRQTYSVWGDFRSYAGLILDGFLLPQILLNVFIGSAEKALSHSFYVGTSAVRLVPHAYNQYRAHNYPKFDLNATYYYANPAADFYSTAWDIIIPCGVVALAVVVFVQQRHGGRCILPQRLRGLEMYEKVAVVENE